MEDGEKQGRADQDQAGDGAPLVAIDRGYQKQDHRGGDQNPDNTQQQGGDPQVPDGVGVSRMMHGFA